MFASHEADVDAPRKAAATDARVECAALPRLLHRMRADADPVLQTLLLPLGDGPLGWPAGGEVLFLNARAGWPLRQKPDNVDMVCAQEFRPAFDGLQDNGYRTVAEDAVEHGRHPLVLVLPPRQREHARALFARAVAAAAPGGRVLACVANNAGAKAAERDLAQLAGPVVPLSKHKCRAFWTAPLHRDDSPPLDTQLAAQWLAQDAPRPIAGAEGFLSRPGVFAWDRIDPASALLAAQLPAELHGRAADLGAGFGYLSAELLQRAPGITALDVYEADRRALDLARRNLDARAGSVALDYHWHDVTAGLARGDYDVIVSNPPFHARDRLDRPDLGRRFIAVAADALRPGGRLYLVANRHLPYEAELGARFGQVRVLAEGGGFKVFEAVGGRA